MKIVCIGGGPSGLYFALLMKQQNPAHDITVVERNKPYDTFGWGVVFSDQTLGNLQAADPVTAAEKATDRRLARRPPQRSVTATPAPAWPAPAAP